MRVRATVEPCYVLAARASNRCLPVAGSGIVENVNTPGRAQKKP